MQTAQRCRDLEQQLKHSNDQLRYIHTMVYRSFTCLLHVMCRLHHFFVLWYETSYTFLAHLLLRVYIHGECQRPQCIQMVQRIKKLEQDLEHANEKLRYYWKNNLLFPIIWQVPMCVLIQYHLKMWRLYFIFSNGSAAIY